MLPSTHPPDVGPALETTPDYWLIVLLRSLRDGDLSAAANAQGRLSELGIGIHFSALRPVAQPPQEVPDE